MSLNGSKVRLIAVLLIVGAALCGQTLAETALTRAKSPLYGMALYEYYQGKSFEALALLSLAKQRGGIEGHGDHPDLVAGGLMLAYGMTREAKHTFEALLKEQIAPSDRNKAWFYLGKVLYLEGSSDSKAERETADALAREALARVDTQSLGESDAGLLAEWHYLMRQLELRELSKTGLTEVLSNPPEEVRSEHDIWPLYSAYNESVLYSQQGNLTSAVSVLSGLVEVLSRARERKWDATVINELAALEERARLSLGQLLMQQDQYQQAYQMLSTIRFESPFAEQALFQYAVAAAHLGYYEQALAALKRLQKPSLFTPWLRQVPYATAYLYEQLGDIAIAQGAYQSAFQYYGSELDSLAQTRASLSEETILSNLKIDQGGMENSAVERTANYLILGVTDIRNDAYGRIRVLPESFDLATLFAGEAFQLALRDLHELYKLQRGLGRWEQQLGTFDTMLATRSEHRSLRIAQTRSQLEKQNVASWQAQQKAYAEAIERALAAEDAMFFIDDEQRDYQQQIEAVQRKVAGLPEGEEKAEYSQKIKRIADYFDWWVADRYGVNRWAAQRELAGLNKAMAEFNARYTALQQEMNSDHRLQNLSERVQEGKVRLNYLHQQLAQSLQSTRERMMNLVHAEFDKQQRVLEAYQLSAAEASARLLDDLYRQQTHQGANSESNPNEPDTPAASSTSGQEVEGD